MSDNLAGKITDSELEVMKLRDIDPETVLPQTEQPDQNKMEAQDVPPGSEVNVTTIDEFLSAIGPDRTIVLDGTLITLRDT